MSAEVNVLNYIDVGAGSTGCLLASRLSKDPACREQLLGTGLPDRNPMIDMPPAVGKVLQNPRFNWSYPLEREAGSSLESAVWMRARLRFERACVKERLSNPVCQIVGDMAGDTAVRQVVQEMLSEFADSVERMQNLATISSGNRLKAIRIH